MWLEMMPSWCQQVKWGNCGIPWVNCAVLCVTDGWKGQFWGLRYCLSKLRICSVFPSGMTSHSKIAQFNWECIGRFKRTSSVCGITHQQILNAPVGWPGSSGVISSVTTAQFQAIQWRNPLEQKTECQTTELLCVFCSRKEASQLNWLSSTEWRFTSRNTKVFAVATVKS